MRKITFILIIGILFTNCYNSQNEQKVEPNPLWDQLKDELELQFGQVVEIPENMKAIVVDITKDEGGLWYGLCYLTDDGLFGRQIPNGMIFTTCVDMLDVTFLNETSIDLVEKLELLNLSNSSIRIGSNWPATTLDDLTRSYQFGIERRKLEQTPCDEDIFGLNPVRECYFDLKKYK